MAWEIILAQWKWVEVFSPSLELLSLVVRARTQTRTHRASSFSFPVAWMHNMAKVWRKVGPHDLRSETQLSLSQIHLECYRRAGFLPCKITDVLAFVHPPLWLYLSQSSSSHLANFLLLIKKKNYLHYSKQYPNAMISISLLCSSQYALFCMTVNVGFTKWKILTSSMIPLI